MIASDDTVSLAITATGYESTGASVFNGTGIITQLVVADAGTEKTSSFELTEVSQTLSSGLLVGTNVTEVSISSSVDTGGGAVVIDSSGLSLAGDINSGSASQTYGGTVALTDNVMFSGNNLTLGGLDGDGHSVTFDFVDTEIDAVAPKVL